MAKSKGNEEKADAAEKTDLSDASEVLIKEYPNAKCALSYGTDFQLLTAVVLSAQATDVSVNKVTPALFKKAPTPEAMAELPVFEIEKIIHTIGMYHQKAKYISKLSAAIVKDFGGAVPGDLESLMSLPGVGRKSANVVLSECFGKDVIAVDTHVFRVANRIGFVNEKDPEKTEKALMEVIPEGSRKKMHHILITHGRRVCHAKKPDCENCPVKPFCKTGKNIGKPLS